MVASRHPPLHSVGGVGVRPRPKTWRQDARAVNERGAQKNTGLSLRQLQIDRKEVPGVKAEEHISTLLEQTKQGKF